MAVLLLGLMPQALFTLCIYSMQMTLQ